VCHCTGLNFVLFFGARDGIQDLQLSYTAHPPDPELSIKTYF
jgi:hypothetical protein